MIVATAAVGGLPGRWGDREKAEGGLSAQPRVGPSVPASGPPCREVWLPVAPSSCASDSLPVSLSPAPVVLPPASCPP